MQFFRYSPEVTTEGLNMWKIVKKCLNVAQKAKKCSNSAQKSRKCSRVLES